MKAWRLFFFLFASLGMLDVAAQAPDQPCVRNYPGTDSIYWSTPTGLCPNFNGFVLFMRTNGGTFSPVDTFTSAAQVLGAYPNASNTFREYYLRTDCGGVLSPPSVTVSNARPETPDLQAVSIVNGVPVVRWNRSATSNVIGYQIYKEQPYGSGDFFPYPSINQLVTGTSFSDVNSTDLLVRYAIVAVTPCDKGPLGQGSAVDGTTGPHSSMVVESSSDRCARTIEYRWNAYENWELGVEYYRVWMRRNGGTPRVVDTVPANTRTWLYENTQNGDQVDVWIEAKELGASNTALSNVLSQTVQSLRTMDELFWRSISIDANGRALLSWQWDIDVDFESGRLLQYVNGKERLVQKLDTPVAVVNVFSDGVPLDKPFTYQIEIVNQCGDTLLSPELRSTFIQGRVRDGLQNELQWVPPNFGFSSVYQYDLYRIIDNQPDQLVQSTSATQTSHLDPMNPLRTADARACYYVVAQMRVQPPGEPARYESSRSNTVCLEQGAALYMPNAFAPEGKNRLFKPVIPFARAVENFQLRIFNRYGEQVFFTREVTEGWNGRSAKGEVLPQGVYVYQIQFVQPNGEFTQQKGNVVLLR